MASGLNNSPLVKTQTAEAAAAETTPGANQAEAHLLDGFDSPVRQVHGMNIPCIGKLVKGIQLGLAQGPAWGILYKVAVAAGLDTNLGGNGITVLTLKTKTHCKGSVVCAHLFEPRKGGIAVQGL